MILFFFFFNDTATTEIYTLSLHDALPISIFFHLMTRPAAERVLGFEVGGEEAVTEDRKSTRLNSSHLVISYAVFCLKKKKETTHCSRRDAHPRTRLSRRAHTPSRVRS